MATDKIIPKKITVPKSGITDGFLKHIKPQSQRFEIADSRTPGLRIRINPTGKINFVWYYKLGGKTRVLTLGQYGSLDGQLTLANARKALADAKNRHAAGELNTSSNIPHTVAELCEVFYRDRILPHRRRPDAVLQVIDHDILPVIGDRKLNGVTAVTVTNCVTMVVSRGAVAHAGKVMAILKQLFKFAESRGYIDRSPAYSLDAKNLGVIIKKRERWLQAEEIKRLWNAIDDVPKMSLPVKNGLKILLLTGVRTGELLKAEWSHIDWEKAEWTIPKENTKSLTEWIVPLTPIVVGLFRELEGLHGQYIFISQLGTLPPTSLSQALRTLCSRSLEIDQIVPHDFRRTIRTHLERLGVQPHIAEKCLNHSLGAINSVYNRNSYLEERREALERWAEFVRLQVNPQYNVTYIAG